MIYAAYSPRTSEAEARAAFVARYGCEPLRVWRHNVVLAGPKPEKGISARLGGDIAKGGNRENG